MNYGKVSTQAFDIVLKINVFKNLACALAATICFVSPYSLATESQTLPKTLRIGVEDINYAPVMNFTEGKHDGLLYQILHEFALQNDIELSFIPLPLNRFPFWFDENAIDIRLPDNARWKLSSTNNIRYSAPMITVCDTTVVLDKNRDMPPNAFMRLGLPIGFTPSSKWKDAIETGKLEIVRDTSLRVLAQMLVNEMIDGIDVNIAIIQNELKHLGKSPALVSVSSSVNADPVKYQISTKHHTEVIDSFNSFVTDNKEKIETWANDNGIAIAPQCDRFRSN